MTLLAPVVQIGSTQSPDLLIPAKAGIQGPMSRHFLSGSLRPRGFRIKPVPLDVGCGMTGLCGCGMTILAPVVQIGSTQFPDLVIPAKAGIQGLARYIAGTALHIAPWMPHQVRNDKLQPYPKGRAIPQCHKLSYKSLHCGLCSSMRAIFHCLFHFFSFFSR